MKIIRWMVAWVGVIQHKYESQTNFQLCVPTSKRNRTERTKEKRTKPTSTDNKQKIENETNHSINQHTMTKKNSVETFSGFYFPKSNTWLNTQRNTFPYFFVCPNTLSNFWFFVKSNTNRIPIKNGVKKHTYMLPISILSWILQK